MIIRAAAHNDLPFIQSLLTELGYASSDVSDVKNIWDELLQAKDSGVIVAQKDEVVTGYLAYSLRPQLRLGGLSMEIDELSVSASFRNQGIGSRLLKHAKDIALNRKVKVMIISTNRERESYKRGFYLKHGFKEKNSAWFRLDLIP